MLFEEMSLNCILTYFLCIRISILNCKTVMFVLQYVTFGIHFYYININLYRFETFSRIKY